MPDWLVSVLIQYPIVVVVGFVAWYAYTKVERVMEARIAREKEIHATSIAELKASHERAVQAIRDEVAKLSGEVRKVGRKVDELNQRMSG